MYTQTYSQALMDTKSVIANIDTLRTIQVMNTWQDRARSIMEKDNITQEHLTGVLGVSTRGAVGHYFQGRRKASVEQLKDLADFLDVRFSWLISGEEPVKKSLLLSAEVVDAGKADLNLSGQPCVPGTDNPPAGVFSEIDALLANATPRSRQQLISIAQAAAVGRLTEADVKMLSDIAKRLEQGRTNNNDDYPKLKADQ